MSTVKFVLLVVFMLNIKVIKLKDVFFFKLENPDYQAKRSKFAFAGNICTASSTGKRYIQ